MPAGIALRLATPADAGPIACMSRDVIERGLGWRWTPQRVAHEIANPESIVLTARSRAGAAVGFGIMQFLEQIAHLSLLGVSPPHQRGGIGRAIVEWLEDSGRVAGVLMVNLELRADNRRARAFYHALGYLEVALLPDYYAVRTPALRMSHYLAHGASVRKPHRSR